MLVNPLIGFIFAVIHLIVASDDYEDNRSECVTFLLASAIWISLVNITKSISGDQYAYTNLFRMVPERGFYGTVFQAWDGSGKEPAYSFITWCLYWATGGNLRLFYFTLSMLIYLFIYSATYKLFKILKVSKGALICGVIVITFFTQYFVMTLQLIRQILAGGIVMYAIVYRAVTGKNNWALLIIAVLIHTSAAFLAGLSLVPWFYSRLTKKRALIVLACFIPFIVFNSAVGSILGDSGISAIDYGLAMYSNTGYTDGSTGMNLGIMLLVFVPLSLAGVIILTRLKREEEENGKCVYAEDDDNECDEEVPSLQSPLYPIVYIYILLMIFVLSFTKSPLVQYRFFYYSYSFIPLLLPLIIVKPPLNKTYWSVASIFFMIRFFVMHNTSAWRYLSVSDMLSSTIYYYWTGYFHWMYLQ